MAHQDGAVHRLLTVQALIDSRPGKPFHVESVDSSAFLGSSR
jgi:hypothetical protein